MNQEVKEVEEGETEGVIWEDMEGEEMDKKWLLQLAVKNKYIIIIQIEDKIIIIKNNNYCLFILLRPHEFTELFAT